jgi:hypothetical protein
MKCEPQFINAASIIWWTLGSLLFIFVAYLIFMKRSVVASQLVKGTGSLTGDLLYSLPVGSLTLKATAKIEVSKSADSDVIESSRVVALYLDNCVQIVPDTGRTYRLTYTPSIFMNDDLKVCVNPLGLLETVSATVEDRISAITGQVAGAASQVLPGSKAFVAPPGDAPGPVHKKIEYVEMNHTFNILAREIYVDKRAGRTWKEDLAGTQLIDSPSPDASFQCVFEWEGATGSAPSPPEKGNVLFSRPLRKVTMRAYLNALGEITARREPEFVCELLLPDPYRTLETHLTRSRFVKKIQAPKYTNGMLTENYINKPSELEGFISIPINIAKGILSIPSALFHFRISQLKDRNTLETERQNLDKTLITSQKAEIGRRAELDKATTDARKQLLDDQKSLLSAQSDLLTAQKTLEEAKRQLQDALNKQAAAASATNVKS